MDATDLNGGEFFRRWSDETIRLVLWIHTGRVDDKAKTKRSSQRRIQDDDDDDDDDEMVWAPESESE